jgi:thiamine-monophosphate kinase
MTNSNSDRRPGEFALIAQLFAPLSRGAPGAFGLTDDVALLTPPPGRELVLTTDALVEGVHFLAGDPPDSVARKALRANLSDLAAKGAEPAGYLMALSLPDAVPMTWLESFARGLAEDQRAFGIALLGGDTTRTPGPLSIAISLIGWIPAGKLIRRAGAKPGDLVFVSGTIGDAGGGLDLLKGNENMSGEHSNFLIERYRLPVPRIVLGQGLHGLASAALDVSDGLLADLGHICEVSEVGMTIEASRIPLSPALQALRGNADEAVARAATSGDDYEIAFTMPADRRNALSALAVKANTNVSEIGRVETGHGIHLVDSGGRQIPVSRAGYAHF